MERSPAGIAAVFDVGKTHTKLSLWNTDGRKLGHWSKHSGLARAPQGYRALATADTEDWLAQALTQAASLASIEAIVPVAHGAAAAVIAEGGIALPPIDYEEGGAPADRAAYDAQRDPFSQTGSPNLPAGLNLGFQLHRLDAHGPWPEDARIVTLPQLWAWRLCGVAATEVSSLGCHTDLWRPSEGRPSAMAERRGWASRFAGRRFAGEVLGTATAEWWERAHLRPECRVLCGMHDSNAALLAARGHPELADRDATVLSTGTWFVAMRAPTSAAVDLQNLPEGRDVLVNVDVFGRPVPSARFMGGREAERLGLADRFDPAEGYDTAALLALLLDVLAARLMVLPSFATGVGPFPHGAGKWTVEPPDPMRRRIAIDLYLALVADAALDLIGSRDVLLVEGRFAKSTLFVRALASLRPFQQVYTSYAHDDVSYGALRLLWPDLAPSSPLTSVDPLPVDIAPYAAVWRDRADAALAVGRFTPRSAGRATR